MPTEQDRHAPAERGPLDDRFDLGYMPGDEPPGIEEREFAKWRDRGGFAQSNKFTPVEFNARDGEAVYYDANDLRVWYSISVPVPEGVRPVTPGIRREILRMREATAEAAREAEIVEAARRAGEWYEAGAPPGSSPVMAMSDARRMGLLEPPQLVVHTAPADPRGRVVVGVDVAAGPDRHAVTTTNAEGRPLSRECWQRFPLCDAQPFGADGAVRVVERGTVALPPFRTMPRVLTYRHWTFILDESEARPRYVSTLAVVADRDSVRGWGEGPRPGGD